MVVLREHCAWKLGILERGEEAIDSILTADYTHISAVAGIRRRFLTAVAILARQKLAPHGTKTAYISCVFGDLLSVS